MIGILPKSTRLLHRFGPLQNRKNHLRLGLPTLAPHQPGEIRFSSRRRSLRCGGKGWPRREQPWRSCQQTKRYSWARLRRPRNWKPNDLMYTHVYRCVISCWPALSNRGPKHQHWTFINLCDQPARGSIGQVFGMCGHWHSSTNKHMCFTGKRKGTIHHQDLNWQSAGFSCGLILITLSNHRSNHHKSATETIRFAGPLGGSISLMFHPFGPSCRSLPKWQRRTALASEVQWLPWYFHQSSDSFDPSCTITWYLFA